MLEASTPGGSLTLAAAAGGERVNCWPPDPDPSSSSLAVSAVLGGRLE